MRYLDEVTFIKDRLTPIMTLIWANGLKKNQLEQYLVQTSLILELTEV